VKLRRLKPRPFPQPATDVSDPAELRRRLYAAEVRVYKLEERLRLARIRKYGPASEKMSALQLELLEMEPGVSQQEVAEEAARGPVPTPPDKPAPRARPRTGRQTLPADLRRVETVIACEESACRCENCGREKDIIGYDESEMLDVAPADYFVAVVKREKRACRRCQDAGVAAAPLPARIIDKSLVSDRIILNTLIDKYLNHLPLYRQSLILSREAGVDITRATMDGWVMRAGELLLPVREAMRAELLDGTYIQADETTVAVQMHDGRGSNHQAYLWQYGKPGGAAVFDFRMGRSREGPREFLGGYEGILQTDGYAAYEGIGGPKLVHIGCWAHARRPFAEALKDNPGDALARELLTLINQLFETDALARETALSGKQRHALRQERMPAVLERMRQVRDRGIVETLPGSGVGRGVRYLAGQWSKLVRFLDHPEAELSNNVAENSMRPVAVGRKNWVHVGSETAGPKVAAILSVIESCRRLGIPVREYLAAILPGLADVPVARVPGLTPSAWAARS